MLKKITKVSFFALLAVLFSCGLAFGYSVNYRSIGTNTGILYDTGKASIDIDTTTVTFSDGASLPGPTAVGAVGVGDELVIGSETFYILSRDSATQVTVQSAATSTHSEASYTIKRAYNDIQTWEDERDGNLVLNDCVEVGVCYKDGPFLMTSEVLFEDSNTDSSHYMHLTVAAGQRHHGIAGAGVVVDGQGGVGDDLFDIRDPYTRLEWLEITNVYDNLGQPIKTDNTPAADGSLIANILLHDYSSDGRGINIYSSITVRNCIVYDGDVGIRMYEDYITVTLDNNTVYNMSGDGIWLRQDFCTAIVRNNISVGCGGQDFDIDSGVTIHPSSGNNLYSTVADDTHPGSNNQAPPLSLEDLFISISSGSENLHIESSGHNALDKGQDLNVYFTDDIDGGTRPQGSGWDIGADESGATVIDLISFTATGLSASILVEWATETELDNEGFNILRSEEADGEYVRINPYFIPAEGEAGFGAEYSYTDYDVQNGVIYYYKLEDVDICGKSTFHGPISATPNDMILIWPPDREVPTSDVSLFSWSSSGSFSFKVEISPNPSFLNSETLSFPKQRWITVNSLWLEPEDWEVILSKVRESEGQLFWRVRAKSEDGRMLFSGWRKFVIEKHKLPRE